MSGVTSTTLQPQGTCPRAQCATMMVNFDRVINAPEPTAPPTQSPSPSPEAEPDESAEPANTDAPAPSEDPAE